MIKSGFATGLDTDKDDRLHLKHYYSNIFNGLKNPLVGGDLQAGDYRSSATFETIAIQLS